MKTFVIIFLCFIAFESFSQSTWKAPVEAKAIKNPLKGDENAAISGQQIFELLCTVCHGDTGRGDGVTLEYLNPKPANLTSKQIQDQTAGEIYWKITTGSPPMQSYVNVLSGNEIWQVVTYVKTLGTDE